MIHEFPYSCTPYAIHVWGPGLEVRRKQGPGEIEFPTVVIRESTKADLFALVQSVVGLRDARLGPIDKALPGTNGAAITVVTTQQPFEAVFFTPHIPWFPVDAPKEEVLRQVWELLGKKGA